MDHYPPSDLAPSLPSRSLFLSLSDIMKGMRTWMFLLWFLQCPAFAMHVIIDPGHGGFDKGTVKRGLQESKTALDVAKRLAEKLRRSGKFRVSLTRDGDHHVSLLDRVHIAEEMHGDLLISIHVNSNPDPRAKGAEFYFQNQLAGDEESMALAHRENTEGSGEGVNDPNPAIQNASPQVRAILEDLLNTDRIRQSSMLCTALKIHWRGNKKRKSSSIRQAPFVVVSEVHMPATLVELGFVSNPEDYKALTSSDYLEMAAQSLFDGIKAYQESLDKAFPPALNSPQYSRR